MLAQEHQQHQVVMMKGKRTKRARTASPLALTMSTSGDESFLVATSSSTTTTTANVESGAHICNSSPTLTPTTVSEEEEDMANCLILLAQGASKIQKLTHAQHESAPAVIAARTPALNAGVPAAGVYVYECKTCNRCFPSFQALGGHRASHSKPKLAAAEAPAPALSLSDDHQRPQEYFQLAENRRVNKVEELGLSLQMACNSSNTLSASNNHHHHNASNNNKSNKVHACAICGAEFSSGQALGGHMRRHRPIAISSGGSPAAKSVSPPAPARSLLCLDLNLPADEQEDQQQQQPQPAESAKFIFGSSEKTLVFANSLVDCRY